MVVFVLRVLVFEYFAWDRPLPLDAQRGDSLYNNPPAAWHDCQKRLLKLLLKPTSEVNKIRTILHGQAEANNNVVAKNKALLINNLLPDKSSWTLSSSESYKGMILIDFSLLTPFSSLNVPLQLLHR